MMKPRPLISTNLTRVTGATNTQRAELIVNSGAGAGAGFTLAGHLARMLSAAGVPVSVHVTRSSAHAQHVAASVMRAGSVLVAVGGDGTVHSVLQACVHAEGAMDILPAGTGNDIATSIFGRADNALDSVYRRIVLGAPQLIDVVAAQVEVAPGDERTEWVLGVTTIGFDSHVNERANSWKFGTGLARYSMALARELPNLTPIHYELSENGETRYRAGILCAVGNGGVYGGGMRICPDADVTDGLLNVTFVDPVPRRTLVRLFPSVLDGTHINRKEVHTWLTSSIGVTAPGVPVFADGEPLGHGSVSLRCVPSAVRILRTLD